MIDIHFCIHQLFVVYKKCQVAGLCSHWHIIRRKMCSGLSVQHGPSFHHPRSVSNMISRSSCSVAYNSPLPSWRPRGVLIKSSSIKKMTKCNTCFSCIWSLSPFSFGLASNYFDQGLEGWNDEMYNASVFVLVDLVQLYWWSERRIGVTRILFRPPIPS
jgi:hypothetical protein